MGLKIKVHYSFYIFLFFVVYFCNFLMFFNYFLALFLHELSHYFISKTSNKMSETMYIYPYGLCLSVKNTSKNLSKNFLIFFIGPFVNILLALICVSVWWLFPLTFYYLKNFVFVNLMLGLFNLIPLVPLDGGNILLLFIKDKYSKRKVIKIMKIISLGFAILFLMLFVYSIFTAVNFTFFCIAFFFISVCISKPLDYNEVSKIACEKVRDVVIYSVDVKTNIVDLKKYFDKTKFVQFYFLNDKKKIVKILSQDDLEKML